MRYSKAKPGRVFIVRLEDGDILHEEVEQLAVKENIKAAAVTIVGGIDQGSKLVVGPEDGRADNIKPMEAIVDNVYEAAGTGTLFPDEDGNPILHLHLAAARDDKVIGGCVRRGVKTWQILEVIVMELTDSSALRKFDPITGFKLLQP
ncbi:MAG: DNA-binding protein [Victivallaceae bacterium]|nr:DNA-binding protein [Victivallaceae bacterium]